MMPPEDVMIAWRSAAEALTARREPGMMGLRPVGESGGLLIGPADVVGAALAAMGDSDASAVRFRRRLAHGAPETGGRDHSAYLMVVHVAVDEAHRGEYRRWLDEEHAPGQLTVPGAEWFAGYEEIGGSGTFLNVWGLADPAVPRSEEWARVRETPWRARLELATRHLARGMFRVTGSAPLISEVPVEAAR